MGQFMLLAERPIEDLRDEKFQSLLQGKPVDVGTEARLDDETLIAADMRGASCIAAEGERSEEHTSELQSLMRISYAVFCLKKKQSQQQTQAVILLPLMTTQETPSTNQH